MWFLLFFGRTIKAVKIYHSRKNNQMFYFLDSQFLWHPTKD